MNTIPPRPRVDEPAARPYAVCTFMYQAKIHAGLDEECTTLESARDWYERACEYIDQSDELLSSYEGVRNPPDAHTPTKRERELAKFYLWWEAFGSFCRRRVRRRA